MIKITNIIIGIIIFIFTSWSLSVVGNIAHIFYSETSCNKMSNNKWLNSLHMIFKDAKYNKSVIKLEDITPFKWDNFYIIQPYTTDLELISLFGFKPKLLGCTMIYFKDDINLLVFQKENSLISYGDVSNKISWNDYSKNRAIPRNETLISIKINKGYTKIFKPK